MLEEGQTAISTLISCRCKKFWGLVPILTSRQVKLYVNKKLYLGCVRPIMYASETWEMTNAQMERLRKVETLMDVWRDFFG